MPDTDGRLSSATPDRGRFVPPVVRAGMLMAVLNVAIVNVAILPREPNRNQTRLSTEGGSL